MTGLLVNAPAWPHTWQMLKQNALIEAPEQLQIGLFFGLCSCSHHISAPNWGEFERSSIDRELHP